MPMAREVNLPRDQKPVWPDRCLYCRAESPGHKTKFWTFAIGWWTVVLLSFGSIFVARVPACRSCARQMQLRRTVRWVVTTLIAAAAAIGAIWVLKSYTGPARIYLGVGIACIGILPFYFIEVLFPPVFDMTCFAKTVDYGFKDGMYALEFEMLNMQADEDELDLNEEDSLA